MEMPALVDARSRLGDGFASIIPDSQGSRGEREPAELLYFASNI